MNIRCIARGSVRLQARDCGAPASPSDLAAGLICLLSLLGALPRSGGVRARELHAHPAELAGVGRAERNRSPTRCAAPNVGLRPLPRSPRHRLAPLRSRCAGPDSGPVTHRRCKSGHSKGRIPPCGFSARSESTRNRRDRHKTPRERNRFSLAARRAVTRARRTFRSRLEELAGGCAPGDAIGPSGARLALPDQSSIRPPFTNAPRCGQTGQSVSTTAIRSSSVRYGSSPPHAGARRPPSAAKGVSVEFA